MPEVLICIKNIPKHSMYVMYVSNMCVYIYVYIYVYMYSICISPVNSGFYLLQDGYTYVGVVSGVIFHIECVGYIPIAKY